jgi:hypothetical protein
MIKPIPHDDFLKAFTTLLGKRKPRKFRPHVWIRPDIGTVEITLEDVSCHHEWIKGEGADSSVWRAMDDDRVVGATLPLRNWNGKKFPVQVVKTLPD